MIAAIPFVIFILSFTIHCQGKGDLDSVVCPDGTECKNGDTQQTCCEIGEKRYGCCLLPNAVCCADRAHCCPERSICDLKRQRCIPELLLRNKAQKSHSSFGQSTKIHKYFDKLMYLIYNRNENVQTKNCLGCPIPNGVCCTDGLHCCPANMTCEAMSNTCVGKQELANTILLTETAADEIVFDNSLPWSEIKSEMPDQVCPGGKMKCRDDNTCCKSKTGDYQCCPLPNATCCSDGLHCCPNGMKCDVPHSRCTQLESHISLHKIDSKENANTILLTETAADEIVFDNSLSWSEIKSEMPDQVCPGGKMKCRDDNTCCKSKTGDYQCCPLPNATCCSDGLHCCPNGMKCDVPHSRCTQLESHISLHKIDSKENGICPDRTTRCTDGSTCCQLPSGGYGCCPYENATCCADKLHCCPNGYKCDLAKLACIKGDISFQSGRILPGEKMEVESVVCPGGHFKCPDNTTCCQLPDGRYGCCPYPNAVCCIDKEHCCPESTKCDIPHQRCVQHWFYIPFAHILLAEKN